MDALLKQQNPISTNATVGLFWYARAEYFVEAAKQMIIKNAKINNSFFIAPAFNEMILREKNVGITPINKSAKRDKYEKGAFE